MFLRLTLIAMAVLVTACSDPKAASEKNFKIAIQKIFDTAPPPCYVNATFPKEIDKNDNFAAKEFNVLTAAGLLTHKEETHETEERFGVYSIKIRKRTQVKSVYNLTEEGKKFYKPEAGKDFMGRPQSGFCFGKATVKDVLEFTEPADAGGVRASRVTFTYETSDIPVWAKLPEVLAAIPALKAAVEAEKTPAKSMLMLTLTNNGWVPQLGGLMQR